MKPDGWSFSMWSLAQKCLREYSYVAIDGLISSAASSGDVAFGSALHLAINEIINDRPGDEIFSAYWEGETDKIFGRYGHKELAEIGLNFISKFSRLHRKNYDIVMAEKRLYRTYKGVKLEGTPDFIGRYKGINSLRDYKTAGYNYAREKGPTALQLNLYAYLAIGEDFRPTTLGYDVFNKGTQSIQTMTWDFNEKAMESMLDDLLDVCEAVDKRTTYPRNFNACIMGKNVCSFFDKCHNNKETQ